MITTGLELRLYNGVIMSSLASQITSLTIVYSTVYSRADQRKHIKLPATGLCVGIHRWPMNSPQKWASNAENVSIWWRHHEKHSLAPVLFVWRNIPGHCVRPSIHSASANFTYMRKYSRQASWKYEKWSLCIAILILILSRPHQLIIIEH